MFSIRISQVVNGRQEITERWIQAIDSRDAFLMAVGKINPDAVSVRVHVRREK